MTTRLYEVGITMSCKTTLNIPSHYSYLKLAKLPVLRSLTWDTDPCSYSHVVMWGKWLYGIQPWSISCCPVKEGGNGVDFRPESRLITFRDLKQENYVKCIKYKLIL